MPERLVSPIYPVIPHFESKPWVVVTTQSPLPDWLENDPHSNLAIVETNTSLAIRLPYNSFQERPHPEQELTSEFISGQLQGLEGYIREHELAQPQVINSYAQLMDDGLHYDFGQKTTFSFLVESFLSTSPISKYRLLCEYWNNYLGYIPSAQQLLLFSQHPEIFQQLVSEAVLTQTPIGLEFAEDVGLAYLQEILNTLEPGNTAVIFSPGDLVNRPTPMVHNWIRCYEKVINKAGQEIIKITQLKTWTSFPAFRRTYELFTGKNPQNNSAAHIVSHPFVFEGNAEQFFTEIGEKLDPEWLKTFDEAMTETDKDLGITQSVMTLIEQNVRMLNDLSIPLEEVERHRMYIGKQAILLHKKKNRDYELKIALKGENISPQTQRQKVFQEQAYGQGSGCGLEAMRETYGVEYGNPNLPDVWICQHCGAVHHIDNSNPSTYYEKCQNCGTSGRC